MRVYIEHLLPMIRENVRGRLLDCGCGYAPYYGIYRDLIDDAIWIDWANTEHSNPNLDAEVDLNGPLPFPDRTFDSVLLTEVLEHVRQPDLLLAEIHRVLRTDGRLVLSVPFYYCLHETPNDYYRYTEYGLRHLSERAGLKIANLVPLGGQPDVLIDVVSKWLATRRLSAAAIFHTAEAFARTRAFQRWRDATAGNFPLGYALTAIKAR
jgi:SAM-dependent methyltransferase